MSTPPPKKKKGGFFGCRSKNALDSLPRNARGDNAAIHRLQARNVFQHTPQTSDSSTSTAVVTPLTEEKGLLKLAELNSTRTSLAQPQEAQAKPLYAQEAVSGSDATEFGQAPLSEHEQDHEVNETEEARDILPDDGPLSPPSRPNTPGAMRSLSVASKTGRIKRSLSLKRSGSTASAKLIARASPVSSADFSDLPASSSSSSDLVGKDERGSPLGDMASIRKARGWHQTEVLQHHHLIADISEDDYLALDSVAIPVPPTTYSGTETPQKKRTMAASLPDSDSMRAVAAALGGSTSESRGEGSEDTVSKLPTASTTARGFWDAAPVPEGEDAFGPGRTIPFQYVTNLSRPVSIASLRSFACPNTPPRTSSRPTSPNGNTYNGLRSVKNFSVSPLRRQGTFNGFPRTFFPGMSSLKHSPSVASNASSRRKPVPEAIPALDFEELHIQRQQRRAQGGHSHLEEEEGTGDTSADDVDRELAGHAASRSHTCSNCGTVEEQRDFASFVAKGKASRRTSVKQSIKASSSNNALTGSLRKTKSAMMASKQDTIGEGTLKRWGLAEAFQSAAAASEEVQGNEAGEKAATVRKPKKMVPGPGGGYITDTANVRWCSALDEIKKALAADQEEALGRQEEERVQQETQSALAHADAVLARLGVET
ncbi:hypothetical protein NDA16_001747 [Ustilago loliicola]|nr:hypothetical protein NDA16_001747 [Ustilago loliicola]